MTEPSVTEKEGSHPHHHHQSSVRMLVQEAAGGLCAGVIGTGKSKYAAGLF